MKYIYKDTKYKLSDKLLKVTINFFAKEKLGVNDTTFDIVISSYMSIVFYFMQAVINNSENKKVEEVRASMKKMIEALEIMGAIQHL